MGQGARVVVADDTDNIRRVLRLFLQTDGYETIEATDGGEALATVRRERPDLIILDVMMPVKDGYAVCRELKADPTTSQIPIIMCTARSGQEDLVEAIEAGAEDFISKPFTRESLLKKVRTILQSNRRKAPRRNTKGWEVSVGTSDDRKGEAPIYKAHVLDVSVLGFKFEAPGQAELNSVLIDESRVLPFILSIQDTIVLEVQGKVAHLQADNLVGISFTDLPDVARTIIDEFVQSEL